MADTAVATVEQGIALGTNMIAGQGTAIVTANTHVITPTGRLEDMVILVENTVAGAKNVIVKAGVNPPATTKGQGDLTVAVGASGRSVLPVLESARFLQANGTVRITVEAGTTGFIMPIQLKRR